MLGSLWRAALAVALLDCFCLVATMHHDGFPSTKPLTEKELLLTFRDGITNWAEVQAAWGMTGWCTGDDEGCLAHVCTWGGVECNPYHVHVGNYVTALRLTCNNCAVPLRGQLRPGLHLLQHLQHLQLEGNQLTGPLPPEWGEPNGFPELLEFNVNNNQLTGNMPDNWAVGPAFLMLADLQMAGNRFSGTFPAGFAITNTSFISVMSFSFADNQFSGVLPEYVNGMITMSVAELHNNRFTGTLPPGWGMQGYWWNSTLNSTHALEYLTLHGNNLTGGLPDAWGAPGAFTVLKQLTLSNNPNLGGTLPLGWGNHSEALPALQDVNASDCGLSGPLPAWKEGLQKLRMLTIADNDLTGTIPDSWAQLPSLQQVTLQPGNADLCPIPPAGTAFKVCNGIDKLCVGREPLASNSSFCSALTGADGGGEGSGAVPAHTHGAFPVAAVAVPLAFVCVAALVAAGVMWRRHQRMSARRRLESKQEAVYQDAESGLFYDAHGMPLPPAAYGSKEPGTAMPVAAQAGGHGSAARPNAVPDRSSTSSWLPCFKHSELATCSSSSSIPAVAQLYPGDAQHPHRSGSVPRSLSGGRTPPGSGSAPRGSDRTNHTDSSPLPGDVSGTDNPCFSSRELAALQLSDWEIHPEEIQILKRPDGSDWQLGSGGFGTVFKAMRNGVQPVAVKVLGSANTEVMKGMTHAEFAREISILRACRDTNILQFQGACFQEKRTLLVTEYMEGGNLAHNLRTKKVNWWRRGKKIALDVARALVYLHSRRIIHLDIKSANVLLQRDGTAKVGDVGMAKIVAGDYVSGVVGTLAWSAPELLMGQRCSYKADCYSFGIVLWELCTGELPVRGQLRDLRVPGECPPEVVDIIYSCLSPDPAARPTATELVELLLNAPDSPPPSQDSSKGLEPYSTAGGGARGDQPGVVGNSGGSDLLCSDGMADGNRPQQQQQQQQDGGQQEREQQPGTQQDGQPPPPPQQQQRRQQDGHQQPRQGRQRQQKRERAGAAPACDSPHYPVSGGWQYRSGATTSAELEEKLVEELVAESTPNGAGYPYSGGQAGAPAGAGGMQRRLVLPQGGLGSASPFHHQGGAPALSVTVTSPFAAAASPFAAAAPPLQQDGGGCGDGGGGGPDSPGATWHALASHTPPYPPYANDPCFARTTP